MWQPYDFVSIKNYDYHEWIKNLGSRRREGKHREPRQPWKAILKHAGIASAAPAFHCAVALDWCVVYAVQIWYFDRHKVSATILLPLTFCGLCGSHGWPRVTMCLEFADVVQPVHACPCLVTPPVVPDASDSQSISAYTIWPAMPNVDQHFSFIFFLLVALATKHKPSIRFKRWYTDRTRWVKNGLSSLLPPGALHIYCWTNKRLNQIIVYRLTNNNLLSHYSTTSTIYQFMKGRYELVNPNETSSVGITSWHVYFYRHWKR